LSTATPADAGAGRGDILDWLHEQGKQRGARVPEFDVEKILNVVRAARKSDSRAESAARAGGSTVQRILLGAQLRRLREAAGITREDAGARVRASGSKISRMELGRVPVKERDVTELLELYGVTDPAQRNSLLQLTHEAKNPAWHTRYRDVLPDWFEAYAGLEEAARLIRVYEVQFVPSLLQTEEYARAVILQGTPDLEPGDTERQIAALMRRQEALFKENAPRLWAIMDEAALRRPVGGREVLVEQIERLIDMGSLPNVTLQIIPFQYGGHTAPGGAFSIMRFPEADLSDMIFMHYPTGSLCIDEPVEVERYGEFMDRLSVEGTSPNQTRDVLTAMLREI
jgi:transcriptional regulator with XRE-family HTH domain